MDSQLRQIGTLVQERRYDEARAALTPYLSQHQHPDAAYGWYLLSFAAETPAAKAQAIRKALQLAPDNEKYLARRAKLGAAAPRSNTRLLLLVGGPLLIGVLIVALVVLRPGSTPSADGLPTLAVTDAGTGTLPPTESVQVVAAASVESVTATSEQPLLVITATEISPTVETVSATATLIPFSEGDVALTPDETWVAGTLLKPPTTETIAPLPTAISSGGGVVLPTQSLPGIPSSTPSPTSQVLTATPVLTGDTGVPVGTSVDINGGSLRVVSATRPGSSLITELGGQAPAPPTGQDWVVVEALVICSGSTNCSPDLSALHVVSASGATYSPSPDFNMPQLFGPGGYALGQVWGYMGFRVPTSETGLRLVLSQGEQVYTFALG